MACSSPLLTPESTPIRPEIIETSTPWSDILLEEFQISDRFSRPSAYKYRPTKFSICRTRVRTQSKILWLSILAIVGLLWAVTRGQTRLSDERVLAAQSKLEGLQFIAANHPSIRVRRLIGVLQVATNLVTVRRAVDINCGWNA